MGRKNQSTDRFVTCVNIDVVDDNHLTLLDAVVATSIAC